MLWINFLHCYQPANSDAHVVKEATEKCYRPLIKKLSDNPDIKFTINISGCLVLRWEQFGDFDVIENLKKLIKKGQLEITGTAAYHPILPLMPKEETIRQIKENEKIMHKFFGKVWHKPKGFFLPEMAYSQPTAKIIKSLGYQWLILDEISYAGRPSKVDFSRVYKDEASQLTIIFRNRDLSRKYIPEILLGAKSGKDEQIFITATDCELYGLRHIDYTGKFNQFLKKDGLRTMTISEYIDETGQPIKARLRASNWESTEKELSRGQPYILWRDKKNPVHKKLWQLADLAVQTAKKFKRDRNYYWTRWHLVRGLSSCTFWWASARDFKLFSAISWSPDEIERGTNELIRSIRSIDNEKSRLTKIKGEKLHIAIKQLIWQKHWANYWKK